MSMDNSNGQSAYDPLLPRYEKPDWSYWETVAGIKLWEAVALAVNIDPRSFYSFGERQLDKFFNRNQPPSFTKLLALALANVAVGGVLKPPSLDLESPEGFEESEVKIARFIKWAKSLNLELPANFPGTTRVALATNVEIQLDGSERSSLLALIAILADQAKIDISQPSKAASLIQSLVEHMGARISAGAIAGHLKRVSSRNAKPFGQREQTTLLVLIAALCKELKVDLSNPSRAAELIEGVTMRKGAHIAAPTIEEFLKRVPTAMAKRAE
jgi:hypothetical protein